MPPPLFPGAEGLGIRRWTIAVVGCLVAICAGVMLADQPYLVFAGLAGLLYVGTLAVNAPVLAWLVIALQPAALIVPFFPGRPFFWELCTLLAWPSLLAHFLVNREKLTELKFDRFERNALIALAGYVGVLVMLMMVRGVGFRALGGGQMGGRVYVQQIVLSILPILMLVATARQNHVWWAVLTGWVLTLTYLLAEFSFSASGGMMQSILYFVELPVDGLNFESGFAMTGLRRFGSLASVASAGLACLWTLASMRDLLWRWIWFGGPLMVGLFGLGLYSGYRNMLIIPMGTLVFLTFFQRFWNLGRVLVAMVVIAGLAVGLYSIADQLPLSIQRSVSFLPRISVSQVAKNDAATTNVDRWEVMKMAVADVPDYLLVGRGFGMGRMDQAPLDSLNSGVALLYAQGMFYNGMLGSLVKTGIPGLICTLLFVWYVSRMAIELVWLVQRRSPLGYSIFDRLCLLLCAQWFAYVMFFYLTNGDVNWWMQYFGLPAALIMACRRLQNSTEVEAETSVPSSESLATKT